MSDPLVYEKSPSLGATCLIVIMCALEPSSLFLLKKRKRDESVWTLWALMMIDGLLMNGVPMYGHWATGIGYEGVSVF